MIRLAQLKDIPKLVDFALAIHQKEGNEFLDRAQYELLMRGFLCDPCKGFCLVNECADCGCANASLLIEINPLSGTAVGSTLYCEKGAARGTIHRLMKHAAKILLAEGIERVSMTTAVGNHHRAFERFGFRAAHVVFEANPLEVYDALEKRGV